MKFLKHDPKSSFTSEDVIKIEESVQYLMNTLQFLTKILYPEKSIDFKIQILINFFANSICDMTNYESHNSLERNFNYMISLVKEFYELTKDFHEEEEKNKH